MESFSSYVLQLESMGEMVLPYEDSYKYFVSFFNTNKHMEWMPIT